MGIQIYIKKEALERKGLKVSYVDVTNTYPCRCGEVEEGYCTNCETSAEAFTEVEATVQGLDKVFGAIDDAIYHDANHWGSNRKPILEFIEKHKLTAGQDWYEG